jgi:hypothetical protein
MREQEIIEQDKLKARDYRGELEIIIYMKITRRREIASGGKRNEKRIDQT